MLKLWGCSRWNLWSFEQGVASTARRPSASYGPSNTISEVGSDRACFKDNLINGRKLITVDASSLPRMGITDFEHIKVIAKKVRELLGIEEPYWNRSISLLHRESLGLFLEKKSNTGVEADMLTFEDYKRQLERQEQSKQTKR